MLVVCGDFIGVHKLTASRIVKLVSQVIATLRPQFIKFPARLSTKVRARHVITCTSGVTSELKALVVDPTFTCKTYNRL